MVFQFTCYQPGNPAVGDQRQPDRPPCPWSIQRVWTLVSRVTPTFTALVWARQTTWGTWCFILPSPDPSPGVHAPGTIPDV